MFNPGFTAPLFAPCPSVTVFHDLQHKRHPEYFRWFDLPFWRLLLWASAHRSRTLIAVSEATRADLLRFYRFPRTDRGDPARSGSGNSSRWTDRTIEPYLLCVSTLHPHKNHRAADARLCAQKREYKLILAGHARISG